jgi:hypothetical protein
VPERPVGDAPDLPPDVPPEYADAYLRGFQRAYAEAAGLGSAAPLPAQAREPAADEQTEQSGEVDRPAEPWQYEPPAQSEEREPTGTWAFEAPDADQDDTLAQPADADAEEDEPWEPSEQDAVDPDAVDPYEGDEPGAVVPGFVLWEGRDERYDEPLDLDGSPRWVMPFLAGCLIVLLFVAIYLLA